MRGFQYTVSDVMTSRVVALAGGAAFKEIVRAMRSRGVGALPVLDGAGRVTGIVGEADLLRAEEHRDGGAAEPSGRAAARAVTARGLATAPAVTVRADATVAGAARLMARHGVKQLPVVDDAGRLIGIVSRSDLLKVFLRSDEDIAQEVRRLVAGRFPVPLDTVCVEVREGVAVLTGHTPDTSSLPLVLRLVRSVEGVVDVRSAITASGLEGAGPVPSGANLPGSGTASA